MFQEVATVGGLDMQLVYYRGLGECRASSWISWPEQLAKTMSQIVCNAGHTQIEKVLIHAQKETKLLRVSGLVFVSDAMEENPTRSPMKPASLGASECRRSCFRRVATAKSSIRSGISRA